MTAPLWRPRQWDAHVPPHLKEPYPWAHPNHKGSFHPFGNPRNTLLFGVALLAGGVFLAITAVGGYARDGDAAALWVAALMLVGLGGTGVWGMRLGLARLRWIRRFREAYGFSPFDRRPDEVDLHRPGR
ncbi:phage holin family protein [Arthrobacter agilis]|jgi:hypothetical protein|uniref:phage holin family protein n=1 Tax=Arthrobacter agilis TaxID=37921 RepID=UPI002783BE4E|nr:phage holin family protein [Arthrobacter agilis]MDQ0736137.1 hypothetical protein [Arthrobacter agilis]